MADDDATAARTHAAQADHGAAAIAHALLTLAAAVASAVDALAGEPLDDEPTDGLLAPAATPPDGAFTLDAYRQA